MSMAYTSDGTAAAATGQGNQPRTGDVLRGLIEDQGGVYRVSQETGLSTSALYRFLEGHELRAASMEILAEHFGYELRPKKNVGSAARRPRHPAKKTTRSR